MEHEAHWGVNVCHGQGALLGDLRKESNPSGKKNKFLGDPNRQSAKYSTPNNKFGGWKVRIIARFGCELWAFHRARFFPILVENHDLQESSSHTPAPGLGVAIVGCRIHSLMCTTEFDSYRTEFKLRPYLSKMDGKRTK